MKRAAVLVLICACKTTSSSEAHMAASAAETMDSVQQVDTNIVEAPGRTTTTIEEFGRMGGGCAEPSALSECPHDSGERTGDTAGATEHRLGKPEDAGVVARPPTLIRRTVIVAEHGAVTIDQHAAAKSREREDSTLSSESESKKTYDFLHGPFALLGGLVALAGVAFAAFKLLKPRLLR